MKIAVVTGASSGMGREIVRQLADRFNGFDEIWVIARRRDRLKELDPGSGTFTYFCRGFNRPEGTVEFQQALEEENPDVKWLINSAGFGKIGPVGSINLADEAGMVALNCKALCAVTHMVLPYLSGNSRIIQLASSASFLPQPDFAIYAATKSFVLSYSRALNEELKPRGIYVTAVCPGPVKTEFFDIAETTGEIPVYKRIVMADPRRVVKKAIRDSMMGRTVSVYGISMKAFHLLCKIMPHGMILRIMKAL